MKILGLIIARGNSKGIPHKNIKELAGKPLIAWTIDAAKKSGIIDRLVLSTNDKEIASIAKRYGAEVPFMRPAELAQDTTASLPVIQHAVSWLKKNEKYEPDAVLLLQPTAPFRQAFHIKEAINLFKKNKCDSVVSLSLVPGHYNPHWVFKLNKKNELELFTGESIKNIIKRRQDLPLVYTRNGAIYIFKPHLLFQMPEPSLYGDKVFGYVMEEKYSVNLDTPDDWIIAESKAKTLN